MAAKVQSVEEQEWDLEPDGPALGRASALSFAAAVLEYRRLAENGSNLAMANLAHQLEYRHAAEGGPDFLQAREWYEKTIHAGSAVVSLPYAQFLERRKDFSHARSILTIGAERGYPPAMVRLASYLRKGIGGGRDSSGSDVWLQKAADCGNLWAKRNLVISDLKKTVNLFKITGLFFKGLVSVVRLRWHYKFNPNTEQMKK
jgi:TPR repeat protein